MPRNKSSNRQVKNPSNRQVKNPSNRQVKNPSNRQVKIKKAEKENLRKNKGETVNEGDLKIFTDASVSRNKKFGGYGIVDPSGTIKNISAPFPQVGTVQNPLSSDLVEYYAIVKAIELLGFVKDKYSIVIFSDSTNAKKRFENVIETKNSTKFLDKKLLTVLKPLTKGVKVMWVKGHSYSKYNEEADTLAKKGLSIAKILYK